MISKDNYQKLKEKYGKVGSWAIWTPRGDNTQKTFNADCMDWADDEEKLVNIVNPHPFHGFSQRINDYPGCC